MVNLKEIFNFELETGGNTVMIGEVEAITLGHALNIGPTDALYGYGWRHNPRRALHERRAEWRRKRDNGRAVNTPFPQLTSTEEARLEILTKKLEQVQDWNKLFVQC